MRKILWFSHMDMTDEQAKALGDCHVRRHMAFLSEALADPDVDGLINWADVIAFVGGLSECLFLLKRAGNKPVITPKDWESWEQVKITTEDYIP